MPFESDPNQFDQNLMVPIIEYLGMQPARSDEDGVLAVISVRFDPTRSFNTRDFCLTQAQALRLRDDLDRLLTTPDSWLCVSAQPSDDGDTPSTGD